MDRGGADELLRLTRHRRAGLLTPQQYLDEIAKLITNFEQSRAASERSIEDTSWDTWLPRALGQRENNLANTWYSYYDGGQMMGHVLDFAIRQNTKNKKSLDDWMRPALFALRAAENRDSNRRKRFAPLRKWPGTDLSDIFRQYISGKEPIPYEKYFAYAGITVEKKLDPTSRGWA